MEAIYAIDSKYGLSKKGFIAWKSNKDMIFFKNKTMNNIFIMGKNTYFSLPKNYRPLKNRLNIVLTSNPEKYIVGSKKRLSNPNFAKKHSEACKGKREIVICPHCNKSGGGGNMRRYHFDKCKLK
jgi:dihydrofolate reductase